MKCPDALALLNASGAHRVGRGGGISGVAEAGGARFHVKSVICETDAAVRLDAILKVDRLLLQRFTWYPPVVDADLSTLEGLPAIRVVRPFVEGTEFRFFWPEVTALIRELGLLWHRACDRDIKPHDYVMDWVDDCKATLSESLTELHGHSIDISGEVQRNYERIVVAAARLRSSRAHLCHGDVHGRNVLFRPSGFAALVDWDDTGTSEFPIDAAKAFWFFCRLERGTFRLGAVEVQRFFAEVGQAFGFEERQLADLPLLGAAYFLPRAHHIRLLSKLRPDLLSWYLEWTGSFWRHFDSNLAVIERAVSLPFADTESSQPRRIGCK